jgi:peptidoglycan/LPS O-acetylase OafA/YrhL
LSNLAETSSRSITSQKTNYRADIDGLRALAVLSVIAFHLRIPMFSGGFVGVDVFFVISGYLITGTLISDLNLSRFSIARFYERRINRIFPALFVMLLVTTLIASMLLLPTDLKDFGKSLISAALSVSNVFFWLQAGYFEPDSGTSPLLHTWSLGVEEQFYIIFPLLLALLHRRASNYLRTIVVIAVCSLIADIVFTSRAPTAAFYLLPSRAWELMVGAILSLKALPAISIRWRNAASLAGLIMIVGANLLFTDATPFPGFAALLPCVGSALLIGAGQSGTSLVSGIFSWKPVVFIGQISYSLYLWHWPLIVFQRTGGVSPALARILFPAVLLAVSFLSWKYVEQPFRRGPFRLVGLPLFRLAAIAVAVGIAAGAFLTASNGLPARFQPDVVKVGAFLKYDPSQSYRTGRCFLSEPSDRLDAVCLAQDPGKKNYLLLGDSHAAHLWAGLSSQLPQVNFMQATAASCKPFLDSEARPPCGPTMKGIFDDYLLKNHVDALVIAAHWRREDLPALSKTIGEMRKRGIAVILIGPIFEYNASLPRLLANAMIRGNQGLPREHLVVEQEKVDSEMGRLARDEWHVHYISLFHIFCAGGPCQTYASPLVPMQFDPAHLTRDGSISVARGLRDRGELP